MNQKPTSIVICNKDNQLKNQKAKHDLLVQIRYS